MKEFIHFAIKATNSCNLHCEYCTNGCDMPISTNNKNIHRREKWELSLDDLVLFCERLKGYKEQELHTITGAEPTMLPLKKLEEMILILEKYNRKIAIHTNGFNLLGIDEKILIKIYMIKLADHGINTELWKRCRLKLAKVYKGKILLEDVHSHYNLREAKEHPSNKGKACYRWAKDIELLSPILYPCCNLPWLGYLDNNKTIEGEMEKAGWTIHNKNLVDTISNIETIPSYAINQCRNNCFKPNIQVASMKKITLKSIDRIEEAQ